MKTVVIVSPYFPPSTLAGVHRARHLAKHLPAHGWHPIVLAVDEAHHEQNLDPDLAGLVAPSIEIIKTKALPLSLTKPFGKGIGDISLRAWPYLRRALFKLLKTRPIDAVLITGSPYYPMLLAPAIKKRFGVPVVLDFQDPWVSHFGKNQPIWKKAGIVHKLATALEPRAIGASSFITSVSSVQNAQLAARYPWIAPTRMAAVPIGGDPDDFIHLRKTQARANTAALASGVFHFSFVGTFMPRSAPVMRQVLRAIGQLAQTVPELASKLQFNFVGTSNQATQTAPSLITPLAEQEGVARFISETPSRMPYIEAISILARSDAVLLVGSDEPHYTASKIYPALMSGRPYLSLFHRQSSSHAILSEAGGGIALAFETTRELEAMPAQIAEAIATLVESAETLGQTNPQAYAAYTGHEIARSYAEIFSKARATVS